LQRFHTTSGHQSPLENAVLEIAIFAKEGWNR
jgi:hypothetical protein